MTEINPPLAPPEYTTQCVGMNMSVRLEKLRFLLAEMQIALRLSKFAPTDFEARMLARHIIVCAASFVEHARRLRKLLNDAGLQSQRFHKTKEAYAVQFDEYFQTIRDRLGAHVQDIDFGRRIELWTDIDLSKAEFFTDGAKEIYRLLEELSIEGDVPFTDAAILSDTAFQIALEAYSKSGRKTLVVEMGCDPLAMTRPHTTAIMNLTPVHARAGQIVLIHRWVKMGTVQIEHFGAFPDVARILRARLVTDVVSGCDCLITRPLSATAPQRMDGLDKLLDAENFLPNPINDFVASFAVDPTIAPFRRIRDKIGAHLEIDSNIALEMLLKELDEFDLKDLLSFYDTLRNVFEKACRSTIILRTYLADGQTISGVLGSNALETAVFDPQGGSGRIVPIAEQFLDTESAYADRLEAWLTGETDERGAARAYFFTACMSSVSLETFQMTENLGGANRRFRQHEFRRVHKLLLDQLRAANTPERTTGILKLIVELRSGDPDVLTELLLRFSNSSAAVPFLSAIAFCLGATARWSNDEAKAFLVGAMEEPQLCLNALVALFKMFVTTEGIERINSPQKMRRRFCELDMLTQGLGLQGELITLVVLASQFCDPIVATFAKPFETEYTAIRAEIEDITRRTVSPSEAPRIGDMVGKLAACHDFVGISLFLFDELKNSSYKDIGRDLSLLVCQGVIVVAQHDQARRHLCGCYLRLDLKAQALDIARRLATQNPDDVDHQILELKF